MTILDFIGQNFIYRIASRLYLHFEDIYFCGIIQIILDTLVGGRRYCTVSPNGEGQPKCHVTFSVFQFKDFRVSVYSEPANFEFLIYKIKVKILTMKLA